MTAFTIAGHRVPFAPRWLLPTQHTTMLSCAAATAVAAIYAGTTANSAQITAVTIVAAGLALAATSWTLRRPTFAMRLRPALYGLILIALAASCSPAPVPTPGQPDPAQPVREYFAALTRGDTATAYRLSRSSSQWLTTDGLAHGYQPPTNLAIVNVTFAPHGNGQLAYIRAHYQLAGTPHESTIEVWKTGTDPSQWAITSGATGRLDVISSRTPRVKIANVEVTTPLTSPRISGGTPSVGYFEIPPGLYTITPITDPALEAVNVAVPAMWRDGTPVTATIQGPPEPKHGPKSMAGLAPTTRAETSA